GHSLKATILAAKIHKEFNVEIPLVEIFKNPDIRGLAHYIKRTAPETFVPISNVEKKEYYVLSAAQKRLNILQQMNPESTAYNMPQAIPVYGPAPVEKLEETFGKIIQRHESLRTSIRTVHEQPVQKVHKNVDFFIPRQTVAPGEVTKIITAFPRPFDLTRPPLMRAEILQLEEEKHILLVDMHHIISDGISTALLRKDFLALYEGKELPPLRIQYKDYAQWQNSRRQKKRIQNKKAYWLENFSDELPRLELPADYPRPAERSTVGGQIDIEITAGETEALHKITKSLDMTVFMVTLTLFNILLAKLTGQEDIIVGVPAAGRKHDDLQQVIGMFVNTLVLRNFPTADKTVRTLLQDVKLRTLDAFENQEYQFEDLVEQLSLPRDTTRNPIFDVMFNLLNMETENREHDSETDAPKTDPIKNDAPEQTRRVSAKFDLHLRAWEKHGQLYFNLEYCKDLFKKETIQRIAGYFLKIIKDVIADPSAKIAKISIIPDEKRSQILARFNRDLTDKAAGTTLQHYLSQSFEKNGSRIALRCGTTDITYDQLEKKSTAITRWIQDNNIKKGSLIGILMEDRIELITAMLGVLYAGSQFAPLDTALPGARIEAMIKETNMAIVLTDTASKGRVRVGPPDKTRLNDD
ncbi:MAG: AMP-binding protein, partial [bacterium]|nr:AMP-binding protein [bacterium]